MSEDNQDSAVPPNTLEPNSFNTLEILDNVKDKISLHGLEDILRPRTHPISPQEASRSRSLQDTKAVAPVLSYANFPIANDLRTSDIDQKLSTESLDLSSASNFHFPFPVMITCIGAKEAADGRSYWQYDNGCSCLPTELDSEPVHPGWGLSLKGRSSNADVRHVFLVGRRKSSVLAFNAVAER